MGIGSPCAVPRAVNVIPKRWCASCASAKKKLVKITHAVKEQRVGVLLFDAHILRDGRGIRFGSGCRHRFGIPKIATQVLLRTKTLVSV